MLEVVRGRAAIVTTTQALGELYVVLQRSGDTRDDARALVLDLLNAMEVVVPTQRDFIGALDLAVDHKLQFWDSLIVTASAEAGCSIFLSEDMQDGFVRHGMTIVNPFAIPMQPILANLLAD